MNSIYSRRLRWILAIWAAVSPAWPQNTATTINLGTQGHNADFSSFPMTRPVTTGTVLPPACVVGQLFFNFAAPAGSNLYGCTASNVWSLQGGSVAAAASPAVALSPTSLAFGSTTQGAASTSQSVVVSNTGNAALTVSSVSLTGTNAADFAQTNNCTSVAAAGSCTITVTFTPSMVGSESARVSIADNASGSPHTAALSGSGSSGTGGLAVTASAAMATVGQSVTLTANRPVTWQMPTGAIGTLATVDSTHATYTAPSSIPTQASTGGCMTLPNDSIFNTPIDTAPVDSRSSAWLSPVAQYGLVLSADYPTQIITDPNHAMIARKFYYGQAGGQYPYYPSGTPFMREGGQQHNAQDGDDHVTISVMVNNNCQWYETYQDRVPEEAGLTYTCQDGTAGCNAQSGISYPATTYSLPPNGSPSASGVTKNLVAHLAEIKAGTIHHALGFTMGTYQISNQIWPSQGGTTPVSTATMPYGLRLRLKSSFDVSGYSPYAQNILNGLKKYGLMLLDKGSQFNPSVDSDVSEDLSVQSAVDEVKGISLGTNFEVVSQDPLELNSTSSEVNPLNTIGVTPVGYAYVQATDAAPVNGTTYSTGVGIALQGVLIGVPKTQLTMLATSTPYTYQLPFWVTGTTNQGVTWVLTSGPGSVTSAGLYTVPTASTVTALTPVVLTGTSAADPNVTVKQYINLLPFSSDGNFRMVMDKSNQNDSTSPNPFTWWAETGLNLAFLQNTGHDYPSWTNVTGNEANIRQYAAYSANSSDINLRFILPNGHYKVRAMYAKECQNYCNATAQYPANTKSFNSGYNSPEFINVNGQVDSANYQWGAAVNYKYSTAWDYFAPAAVTANTLDYWQGGIVPQSSVYGFNPGPELSAIEIIPDTSAAHIAIDTGMESWDYVTGAVTTKPLVVAGGATAQLGTVGWYMPNTATWTASAGSISSNGLFTAPAATLDPQTVTVKATSTVDGTKTATATLVIPGNGVVTTTVSPASLTFPSTYLGTPSAAQTFTVQNTGTATLTTSAISFAGTNAADFSQSNNCASVAAGASCTVSVIFTPSITGPESATIALAGNEAGSPQTAAITGTGAQGTASGSLAPAGLTFPSTQDGNPSAALTLTLGDSGTGGLLSPVITFTGANGADFSQTNTCGASVAPGTSCTVSVVFTPSIVGTETATISIADNATNSPQTATLSGSGTASSAVLSMNPANLTFAQTSGDQSVNARVTISNTGTGSLVIKNLGFTGTNAGDFGEIDNCSSLAAGASCTVLVTFKPNGTIGAEAAALSITDNSTGSPHSLPITAQGYYGGSFFLQPQQIMFAPQTVGTAATKTIVFSNTGGTALSLSSFAFSGPNIADFAQTNTCGSSIPGNGNCTISVTFTPSTVGVESATLTIIDSGGYASPTSISVGGIGH